MPPNRWATCPCRSTNCTPICSPLQATKDCSARWARRAYIRPGLEAELTAVRQGGTGSRSDEDRQPDFLPDKFEAGNHNVPGLVGLAAALAWLEAKGVTALHDHEQRLSQRLRNGLRNIPANKAPWTQPITHRRRCQHLDRGL